MKKLISLLTAGILASVTGCGGDSSQFIPVSGGGSVQEGGSDIQEPAGRPVARQGHSMAVIGSDIYLFGGNAGSNNQPKRMNDLWVFRSDNETWEKLAVTGETPSPVRGHTAAVYNDKMYIFGGDVESSGGITIPGVQLEDGAPVNDFYVFDPAGKTWSKITGASGEIPTERTRHTAFVMGTKMYVFGGTPSIGWSGEMFEYDFAANSWRLLFGSANSSDTEARANHAADAADSSTAFIFGGFGYNGAHSDLKSFSTSAPGSLMALTPRTPFQGRNNPSLTALKSGQVLAIYGGVSGNKTLDELYLYGVSSNINKKFPGSVTGLPARQNHRAVEINGKLYVFGGTDGSGNLTDTTLIITFKPFAGDASFWGVESVKSVTYPQE